MLTWILIAILIAALFGVINLDNVRRWLIIKAQEIWPHVKKVIDEGKKKIEESQNKNKK